VTQPVSTGLLHQAIPLHERYSGAQHGDRHDVIDARASLLSAEKLITGDKYVFIRNAYLQNREFRIKDGEIEDDF
jgi:ABC-type transporter lipoprotein component MlaA